MSFFNKKEDVIDIQLTQHGKYLLSKGRFKPAYYAFYDDDIIYDSSCAGAAEDQNDTQQRIEDTPRLKTQYNFSPLTTNRLIEHVRADETKWTEMYASSREAIQPTSDKHYGLVSQIGTSSIGKQHAPAWRITLLKGEIESSATHTPDGKVRLPIPQIEPEPIKYVTQIKSVDGSPLQPALISPTGEDFNADSTANNSGAYIDVKDDYILLNVEEINTDFDNDNFDIEVFEVEVEVDDEGKSIETLIPLRFVKMPELIKDGILLDEPDGLEGDTFPTLDPTYVGYWFDISCDSEIDDSILCDIQKGTPRGNIFTQDALDCAEDKDIEFQDILTEEEDEC